MAAKTSKATASNQSRKSRRVLGRKGICEREPSAVVSGRFFKRIVSPCLDQERSRPNSFVSGGSSPAERRLIHALAQLWRTEASEVCDLSRHPSGLPHSFCF